MPHVNEQELNDFLAQHPAEPYYSKQLEAAMIWDETGGQWLLATSATIVGGGDASAANQETQITIANGQTDLLNNIETYTSQTVTYTNNIDINTNQANTYLNNIDGATYAANTALATRLFNLKFNSVTIASTATGVVPANCLICLITDQTNGNTVLPITLGQWNGASPNYLLFDTAEITLMGTINGNTTSVCNMPAQAFDNIGAPRTFTNSTPRPINIAYAEKI